tara:strand:+ start:36 stop:890 length:855 start_codon:yes stop_codon:yes gene_type:complete
VKGPISRSIETPSGKNPGYENFPVGSFLLPATLRPHVAIFYKFARTIDDIADNPNLDPNEKVHRLDGFEKAIIGTEKNNPLFETGHLMRESLKECRMRPKYCVDLISAFKQDAIKLRYKNWDDLMSYCSLSAAPVGRYLLDLHGGSKDGYGPSDALCKALQVINHIQDCQDDFNKLNRVYLPLDWMAEERISFDVLSKNYSIPGLRRVVFRLLDATEDLMQEARKLPSGLYNLRLSMESGAIIRIADRLIQKLRKDDPLVRRVELNTSEYFSCVSIGAISGFFQ